MLNKAFQNRNGPIRRATLRDLAALLDICRNSFSNSVRWHSLTLLSKRWWNATITSSSSETWLCLKNGRIVGFCVLITDEIIWAKEEKRRAGPLLCRLLAFVVHPKLTFSQIWRRIVAATTPMSNHSERIAGHPNIGERTWIGLIAVAPPMRRQGLATQMMNFCEYRTMQLCRPAIQLRVDADNTPGLAFYERTGFVCTLRASGSRIYTKVLSQ